MSRQHTPTSTPDDYADEPIYWFAVLDKAVEHGDHAAAAEAQRELDRLGVAVRYGRPRHGKARQPVSKEGHRHE
jgi:hypothetical protein